MWPQVKTYITAHLKAGTAGALLVCALPNLCLAERQYEVTELPSPANTLNRVVWVGEDGQMSGSYSDPSPDAFATRAGTHCYSFDGTDFAILAVPAGTNCTAYAGNSLGELAGQLLDLNRTPLVQNIAPGVGFVYRDGQFLTLAASLPDLRQVINSAAAGINDHGDVIGFLVWQDPRTQEAAVDGWVYRDGEMQTLPGLGGRSTRPNAINEAGDIAADALTPPGPGQQQHAVLIGRGGGLTDLGTLGGPTSSAAGLNILGQVVGYSTLSADPHALRVAFFYNGTAMLPIAMNQATRGTAATGINDGGEVIGAYYITDDKGLELSRAFYYFNGQAVPLDSLVVDGPPGVTLVYPTRIYNDGRIICFGTVEGNSVMHTYLLMPVEEGNPTSPVSRHRWRRR